MTKRTELLYLTDILNAIRNIEKYTKKISFTKFCNNQLIMDAVIRNLEIIGEATKHISNEIKVKHHDIPWKAMAGMRDKVAHEYFGVDNEIIWKTIKISLPSLKKMLKMIKS